jgi:indolepyruvate ferredoxin oxidoreductase beta subunit
VNNKTNIVLTGIGGQGIITASTILGKTAVKKNVNVYISEIHGMAQRGGAVISIVRMGDVSGSLIATGMADVILSTEPIEALRNIMYANLKTKVITDINPVIPFTVAVWGDKYPDLKDVFNEIHSRAELYKIDALKIAKESGVIIAKNIVMLGALAATGILPFESNILLETILDNVPKRYIEENKKAFIDGMNVMEGLKKDGNEKF